ncbi:MAG: bifunctional ornithine acetyltransferase/N-acetylglutamate synthase [Methanobrevibacter sp.]|uniref:Glutamate N-acetyltransferase n=1 Tax=Methanobrevibacter millerae TaxID=230361 RepID=A0A8T3VPL3_9EURY|nr:bifunctional ornithine acetyltransferase/N-acetylglutamate synthase [Methanobrevibacter millerae]MBE6506184.1 bifunctional ornithine acetyltransferase/N-acetylglutamate synthase [Methanobrevibacter millerae]MBR0058937.1 bifunctional ornithine acetyltransferase/N-acetylglutamate synthase [Methanobrevibacter sp.]MBR0370350.1 bifunctional ornithine acetyltransferase/N-acetylglutamate synthase [Methanobrevibacter sp.]
MEFIREVDGGFSILENVKVSGAREGKYGVSVILAPNSTASAVFTTNKVVAASVRYTKNVVKNGIVSAVVVNSGNANCFTGQKGIEDCEELVNLVSKDLKIPASEIAICSTGVIGREMPMDIISKVAYESISKLGSDAENSLAAAKAIMTTDTFPKEEAVEVTLTSGEVVKIAGITKGSGMIAPNMATMLSFIVTDAEISQKAIKQAVKKAADLSFNMIVVDGDESTNDTCLLMANGASGVNVEKDGEIDSNFQEGLNHLCINLAKKMARDGEGASKFIEANVCGAESFEDAKLAAKAIVTSPLFKSAVFGGDPNWGRIVSAIGYSGCELDQNVVTIAIADEDDEVDLVRKGEILAFENTPYLERAEKIMQSKNIAVNINMFLGDGEATAWGCDLTYDYVKINAEYTT